MKREDLLFAITDIRDQYIIEYVQKNHSKQEHRQRINRIAAIAACLAIILLTTAVLAPYFSSSNMDYQRYGYRYHFSSYEELKNILPENHVLRRISIQENSIPVCYGTQIPNDQELKEGISIVSLTYEQYFDISVRLNAPDSGEVHFLYEIGLDWPLDKYCSSRALFGPSIAHATVVDISGHEVYYAQQGIKNIIGYTAAVKIDKDILVIDTEIVDEAAFLAYLNALFATGDS